MNREQAKKLAPIIAAFADGKDIQRMSDGGNWMTITRTGVLLVSALDHLRIKPDTVKYRRYLYRTQQGRVRACVLNMAEAGPASEGLIEAHPTFIRWIDKDWIEGEI